MNGFANTPLGESLANALATGDAAALGAIEEQLLSAYEEDSVNSAAVEGAVAMSQSAKSWAMTVSLAEAVISHEDADDISATLRRHYSQALIERGALTAAECVLGHMSNEDLDDKEAGEVAGLLGRVAKQRYVNFKNHEQLRKAIRAYGEAYTARGADKLWVGGNLLALLHRAERDDVPVPRGVPRATRVRDDLWAVLDETDPMVRNVWQQASAIELMIAKDDEDGAVKAATFLARASGSTPFELSALRRQLSEVWELPEDHEVILALAAAELGSGARSSMDVPETESLEKILGKEYPVAYDALVKGLGVAQSVCMIADRYDNAVGTGFVIEGSQLSEVWNNDLVVVTNSHVVPDELQASMVKGVFTKLPTKDDQSLVTIDKFEMLWSSPTGVLDATVLGFDQQLLPEPDEAVRVSSITPSIYDRDPFVYVIGHPKGRPLSLSIRGNELLDANETKLHYMAPTEPGSSGSPVFDQQWDLVGLHRAGSLTMPRLDRPDERYPANEATNIEAIREAIGRELASFGGLNSLRIEMAGVINNDQLAEFQTELAVAESAVEMGVETGSEEGLESIDPLTAISVAISTVDMARRVWRWWRNRNEDAALEIIAKLPDGIELRFSGTDEQELDRFLTYLADRSKSATDSGTEAD